MKDLTRAAYCLCALLFACAQLNAQQPSATEKIVKKTSAAVKAAEDQSVKISKDLNNATEVLSKKISKYERRLSQLLSRSPSSFGNASELLNSFRGGQQIIPLLKSKSDLLKLNNAQYIPRLDSLSTTLAYIGFERDQLDINISELRALKSRMGIVSDYQRELVDRQKQWLQLLQGVNLKGKKLPKSFRKMQTELLSYKSKVQHWREAASNSNKLERELLAHLAKVPAFIAFFEKNSELNRLFGASPAGSVVPKEGISGLQTIDSVGSIITSKMGGEIGSATQLVEQLKTEMENAGDKTHSTNPFSELQNELSSSLSKGKNILDQNLSGDMTTSQYEKADLKAKSIKQRIELGWNIQTGRRVSAFPVTNDVGLSVGYKLTPKNTIGFGGAYKFGLGTWQKIRLSHEGFAFRSFVDWKISPSKAKMFANIWLTGGFELNYWQRINGLDDWRHLAWQKSGVIGIFKKAIINRKEVKVQLLYDFINPGMTSGFPFQVRYNSTF